MSVFPPVREEHPQTHLANVCGAQVVAQTRAVAQVVRRHLDRRLADRVGDLGYRVGVRLDDHHSRRRTRAADLQRQRESRDASSDDAHVVIRCRGIAGREARSDALGESLSCLLAHLRHLRPHVHASPSLDSCRRSTHHFGRHTNAHKRPPAVTRESHLDGGASGRLLPNADVPAISAPGGLKRRLLPCVFVRRPRLPAASPWSGMRPTAAG